jgi:hypothetical protein
MLYEGCWRSLGWRVLNVRSIRRRYRALLDSGGMRAAAMYTLIESAKMNGLNPEAYPRDVLARIADHPINRIGDPLPWNWKPTGVTSISIISNPAGHNMRAISSLVFSSAASTASKTA